MNLICNLHLWMVKQNSWYQQWIN